MKSYSRLQISLHWIVALVVVGLFASGFWMVELTYYSPWYKTAPFWHKSVGVVLAALVVWRLLLRLKKGAVDPVPGHSKLVTQSSHLAHALLYLLLVVIVSSGYLISTADGRGIDVFGWFEVPALGQLFDQQSDRAGLVHQFAAYSLIGFAVVHGLAALKHHFVDKDLTLKRMLSSNLNEETK
ncbi:MULTISPECIES: cytochrome b [Rheinheimera]|uniref:Cytochrome b n=1 Tax=Rheinheimera marina TaxID=1774958 RepID=A0ABV9JIZ2_9GAMM